MALSAQFITGYDPLGHSRNWSIKGKVLPFVLGDESGISALAGIEYGFSKNQSVGIDGFFESTSKSDENSIDTAGVMHPVSQYYHGTEKAVFFNYRYYLKCGNLREKRGIAPYLLTFLRYSRIHQHYDPLYPLTGWLTNDEMQYSLGLMGGALIQFSHTGRLCLDINTGVFMKKRNITTVYLKDRLPFTVSSNPLGPGFRLSVNLVYWFYLRPTYAKPLES